MIYFTNLQVQIITLKVKDTEYSLQIPCVLKILVRMESIKSSEEVTSKFLIDANEAVNFRLVRSAEELSNPKKSVLPFVKLYRGGCL